MKWALSWVVMVCAVCLAAGVYAQEGDKPAIVKSTEDQLKAEAKAEAAKAKAARAKRSAKSKTVTLRINTQPRVRAGVYWGKEKLGVTPLTLQRPRDSGPMDIKVVAGGYIAVNTRLYTFKDDDLVVTLTPASKANTLYGYKKPLPPDAGLPEIGEDTPVSPLTPVAPPVPAPAPAPVPAPALP